MSFIEFYGGCGDFKGCFGPRDPYITIFGTELWHLIPHFIISLFVGLILFSKLFHLKKKQKITLDNKLIIIISIATLILLFFILAFFFSVRVLY